MKFELVFSLIIDAEFRLLIRRQDFVHKLEGRDEEKSDTRNLFIFSFI